jgi:hypothetical protein
MGIMVTGKGEQPGETVHPQCHPTTVLPEELEELERVVEIVHQQRHPITALQGELPQVQWNPIVSHQVANHHLHQDHHPIQEAEVAQWVAEAEEEVAEAEEGDDNSQSIYNIEKNKAAVEIYFRSAAFSMRRWPFI